MNVWRRCCWSLILITLGSAGGVAANAANVLGLSYDAKADKLVIQIAYRATHSNHVFSVEWGQCRHLGDERPQIVGLLVDSDPKDPAREDFSQVLEISLAQQSCRPAKVTIRTDAGFHRSVEIPAAPSR